MFAISPNGELLSGTRRDNQADVIRLMAMISMALSRDCSGWGDVNGCDLVARHVPKWGTYGDWVGLCSQYRETANCSVGRVATVKLICLADGYHDRLHSFAIIRLE